MQYRPRWCSALAMLMCVRVRPSLMRVSMAFFPPKCFFAALYTASASSLAPSWSSETAAFSNP